MEKDYVLRSTSQSAALFANLQPPFRAAFLQKISSAMTTFAQTILIIGCMRSPIVVSEGVGWVKNAILSSPMDTMLEFTPVPALAVGLGKKLRSSYKSKPVPTVVDGTEKIDQPQMSREDGQLKMQVTSQNSTSGAVKNSKLKTKTIYHLKVPKHEPAQAEKEEEKSVEEFKSLLNTPGHVSVEEVSLQLITELKATLRPGGNHDRIFKWEEALRPMFASLEKNIHGNLDQASARYVLHRIFARRHGWYMTGLEPRDVSSGPDSLKEWVPSYLLNLVEELLGTQGINNQELAVLAATFEDLAHKEALGRLKEIYEDMHLPIDGHITDQIAEEVIQTYMAIYTSAEDLSNRSAASLRGMELDLGESAQVWLREVQHNVTAANLAQTGVNGTKTLDFQATSRIVEHVGQEFSTFNHQECRALKSALLEVEDNKRPGHVRLYDFYKKGLEETFWTFDESIEYLRVLGALDETESQPRVIVPNYVSSETNCLTASTFYKSCCRSECEDLMEHLEREINAPTAYPAKIAKIVAGLPSDGMAGPGALSPFLVSQLNDIAANGGGQISLHSRSFAQWMHNAFPRECPVPHASNHPQTPDEWLAEYGVESTKASREVRLEHLELHAYDEEQMPWNVDAIVQQQCPIPEPYISESEQEEEPLSVSKTQPIRKISLGQFARSPTKETETQWQLFGPEPQVHEQTQAVDTEKPWHMYEIPDQTPASDAHLHAGSEQSGASNAEIHLKLPRSANPVPAQVPDADTLFHQVYDTPSSGEDEVIPMGKAQLPKFETPSEPATSSTPWSETLFRALQKIEFLFMTFMVFAAVTMEWMRKRNEGWSKRNDDYRPGCGDIDMGLVRMAAAASVNQRSKASALQDIV